MSRYCDRPDDCRISQGVRHTTDMYYPPMYDGHGRNLNPDGNVTYYSEHCSTCGRSWDVSEQRGECSRKERK